MRDLAVLFHWMPELDGTKLVGTEVTIHYETRGHSVRTSDGDHNLQRRYRLRHTCSVFRQLSKCLLESPTQAVQEVNELIWYNFTTLIEYCKVYRYRLYKFIYSFIYSHALYSTLTT